MDRNARKVKRSVQEDRSKESCAKTSWLSGVAKDGEGTFLSAQQRRERELDSTAGRHCESLSWKPSVDIPKVLRIREERHVTVEGSEDSYVSFDRVGVQRVCMSPPSGAIRAFPSRLVILMRLHAQRVKIFAKHKYDA